MLLLRHIQLSSLLNLRLQAIFTLFKVKKRELKVRRGCAVTKLTLSAQSKGDISVTDDATYALPTPHHPASTATNT